MSIYPKGWQGRLTPPSDVEINPDHPLSRDLAFSLVAHGNQDVGSTLFTPRNKVSRRQLTLVGAPTISAGVNGRAFKFTTNQGFKTETTQKDLTAFWQPSANRTQYLVVARVRRHAAGAGVDSIVGRSGPATNPELSWIIRVDNTNNRITQVAAVGANTYVPGDSGTGTFVASTWYDIAIGGIHNSGGSLEPFYFINGKRVGTTSTTATTSANLNNADTGNICVACATNGTSEFAELEYEYIHVFRRVLNVAEINELMVNPYCMYEAPTAQSYYSFPLFTGFSESRFRFNVKEPRRQVRGR